MSVAYILLGDNMNNNQNTDIFFLLSVLANVLQVANYIMNVQDLKNSDLFTELQKQDRVLDEQINVYLKKIMNQNEEIISLLKERNG